MFIYVVVNALIPYKPTSRDSNLKFTSICKCSPKFESKMRDQKSIHITVESFHSR